MQGSNRRILHTHATNINQSCNPIFLTTNILEMKRSRTKIVARAKKVIETPSVADRRPSIADGTALWTVQCYYGVQFLSVPSVSRLAVGCSGACEVPSSFRIRVGEIGRGGSGGSGESRGEKGKMGRSEICRFEVVERGRNFEAVLPRFPIFFCSGSPLNDTSDSYILHRNAIPSILHLRTTGVTTEYLRRTH